MNNHPTLPSVKPLVPVFVLFALLVRTTLPACGGSSGMAANSPSVTTTPSAAATPEHLMGSDSVAVTQEMVDHARAALDEPTAAKLARDYTRESVVDDFGVNARFKGNADALKAFRQNLRAYSGATWTAGCAGRGVTVLEERRDFTKTYGGTIQLLAVAETRDGKIARETLYYNSANVPF